MKFHVFEWNMRKRVPKIATEITSSLFYSSKLTSSLLKRPNKDSSLNLIFPLLLSIHSIPFIPPQTVTPSNFQESVTLCDTPDNHLSQSFQLNKQRNTPWRDHQQYTKMRRVLLLIYQAISLGRETRQFSRHSLLRIQQKNCFKFYLNVHSCYSFLRNFKIEEELSFEAFDILKGNLLKYFLFAIRKSIIFVVTIHCV